jgi:SM-20-related protein
VNNSESLTALEKELLLRMTSNGYSKDVKKSKELAELVGSSMIERLSLAQASNIKPSEQQIIQPAYLVLEEFLTFQELKSLTLFTMTNKDRFQQTRVMQGDNPVGVVDYNHRKSFVLFDMGTMGSIIRDRILSYLPWIFKRFEMQPFRISQVEVQLTRSGHEEFFKLHSDNTSQKLSSRKITFVYYFYKEPKSFYGGDLRLYEYRQERNGKITPFGNAQVIKPLQNQMIVFLSHTPHEVMPVYDPEQQFENGRFTLNGWIHKAPEK